MRTPLIKKLEQPKIAIVGPCGAGKSTLAQKLRPFDLEVKEIAQEHSFVPAMWQKISQPDILIFLDVSFPSATMRKNFNWTEREYSDQVRRLQHARKNCDIYIHTDNLTPDEILKEVLNQLDVGHLSPSDV
jgi:ABC-type transport system involved in cytochrome bd biosynthesis fused ATPase/permease subunit